MSWRQWLTRLGLEAPATPDLVLLALAALAVAGAYALGHLLARWAAPRVERQWRRAGQAELPLRGHGRAALRHLAAALLLVLVDAAAAFTPYASLLLAAGLGVAAGLLAFHLLRGAGLPGAPSMVAAAFTLVAATAGPLGGLSPLAASLDSAALVVGARRVSLLDAINALLLLGLLFVAARIATRFADRFIARAPRLDPGQRVLAQKIAGIAIVAAAVLIGVDAIGLDLTALAVFSGAFGLAVGFGLQKTFGNLLAGLILLMDRSVKPGDVIVVGDTFGAVSKVGVRAVSVLTRDGKEHLIPNELLMTERVENWSYSSTNVRIRVPVGVSYDCDLDLAQRLMTEAASANPRVLADPAPRVWLTGFGESSVDHEILAWIADPEDGVGNVRSDILNSLWRSFKAHGVEIPYPQRDLRLREVPEQLVEAVRQAASHP